MIRGLVLFVSLAFQAGLLATETRGQEGAIVPNWIWHPSSTEPGAETRFFRKEILVKETGSRLALDATADNRFVLYLDGREILRGDDWQRVRSVNLELSAGEHVLAAMAENEGPGPAGFLVRGSVLPLGQGIPVHTNRSWKSYDRTPDGDAWKLPGFDDSEWSNAINLGALGTGPWRNLMFESGDAAERFKVPAGFRVSTVAAPGLTGSAVSFTFDHQGRPCVGVERAPVIRLIDAEGDGTYEDKITITPSLKNCQGLHFDVNPDGSATLWAVGEGPNGTGIYHLADADGDEIYETVIHDVPTDGMAEHGPHAVQRGPDGWLYFNAGNHAHIKLKVDGLSPVNQAFLYEGELLTHYGDPRGHAVRIKAPGGEIYRSRDHGMSWERIVCGFRNQYDFAFNRAGDLFSFDSDMEWDLGLPWYRPVRVNFCPIGAELGWRTGTAVWPGYYYDSLPAVLDVGRGSPTGVTFYQGQSFPQEYEDAFLYCDWSQGRILAARFEPSGASYAGKQWELVSGQPLNCTDIEVGPDGAVYFTTGGRGTLGGLYRVQADHVAQRPAETDPVLEAIRIPSPLSSFSRARVASIRQKHRERFQEALLDIIANQQAAARDRIRAIDLIEQYGEGLSLSEFFPEPDPAVRARMVKHLGRTKISAPQSPHRNAEAQSAIHPDLLGALRDSDARVRRAACEALLTARGSIPSDDLLPLLDDPDRWVRYTARVAIEHGDLARKTETILALRSPRARLEGMLALVRVAAPDQNLQARLLDSAVGLLDQSLTDEELLDLYRLVSLIYQRGPAQRDALAATARLGQSLTRALPATLNQRALAIATDTPRVEQLRALLWEQARLLAYLDAPHAVPLMLLALEQAAQAGDRVSQVHFAYCLCTMQQGWTPQAKRQLWNWFEAASRWDGGYSYQGYLDFMIQDLMRNFDQAERLELLASGAATPFPTRVLVRSIDLDQEDVTAELAALYERAQPVNPACIELRALLIERLGRGGAAAHAALRDLATRERPHRALIIRNLAARAQPEDLPLLVEGIRSNDANTARAAIAALTRLDAAPEGSEPLRNLLVHGRMIEVDQWKPLHALASKWYQSKLDIPALEPAAMQEFWEAAYGKLFPDAPPLEASSKRVEPAYTLDELIEDVVRAGRVARGSPQRGRRILESARCLNCHKLGDEGAGLGPDLSTLSSRFRDEEILEAMVEPSKVISDQYKSITVALSDGQVFNGMPAGGDGETLVLLLSDGTKVNLAKDEIEEQAESSLSVMPAGLLNTLSLDEIADLLALFAAQPRVEIKP